MRYLRFFAALVAASLLFCSCVTAVYDDNAPTPIATGKGSIAAASQTDEDDIAPSTGQTDAADNTSSAVQTDTYIVNTNTKVIHKDKNCSSVLIMSDKNKKEINMDDADKYLENGYHYCSRCSADKSA